MPTDSSTLIWCLLVPAVLSLATSLLVAKYRVGESLIAFGFCGLIAAVAWCAAIGLSFNASESLPALVDFADEAWPKILWPMLASAVIVVPFVATSMRDMPSDSGPQHQATFWWLVYGIICVLAASIIMPTGDGWSDVIPTHQYWIAAVSIASIANAWMLVDMANRGANRWLPLVILAGLACPAIIGAVTYGALLQACLAAIVATTMVAIVAAWKPTTALIAIVFPSVMFMSAMVATGRFFSYAEVPYQAYGLALFAPTLIATADRLVVGKRDMIRIGVAAVVAILIVGITGYVFIAS